MTTLTTIIVGALVVGTVLGLLGSGGSAVAVPILVYLVGHNGKVAIAESMAIVGAISLVGAIPYARAKNVDWQSVLFFGIPAMMGTWIGAWLSGMASSATQLIVFAIVILFAAITMLRNSFRKPVTSLVGLETPPNSTIEVDKSTWKLILVATEGITVGALTGFVGVGGGFLIVPALLLLGKLPMRVAIGTSLVIVTLKSVVGLVKYQSVLASNGLSIDWFTVAIFSGIGLIGCAVGQQVNSKLDQRTLKKVFAVFLIVIGVFVIVKECRQLI